MLEFPSPGIYVSKVIFYRGKHKPRICEFVEWTFRHLLIGRRYAKLVVFDGEKSANGISLDWQLFNLYCVNAEVKKTVKGRGVHSATA